jgi:hypothetical protein
MNQATTVLTRAGTETPDLGPIEVADWGRRFAVVPLDYSSQPRDRCPLADLQFFGWEPQDTGAWMSVIRFGS